MVHLVAHRCFKSHQHVDGDDSLQRMCAKRPGCHAEACEHGAQITELSRHTDFRDAMCYPEPLYNGCPGASRLGVWSESAILLRQTICRHLPSIATTDYSDRLLEYTRSLNVQVPFPQMARLTLYLPRRQLTPYS